MSSPKSIKVGVIRRRPPSGLWRRPAARRLACRRAHSSRRRRRHRRLCRRTCRVILHDARGDKGKCDEDQNDAVRGSGSSAPSGLAVPGLPERASRRSVETHQASNFVRPAGPSAGRAFATEQRRDRSESAISGYTGWCRRYGCPCG